MLRRTSVVPRIGSSQPHAVREFQDERVAWLIEREVLRRAIDVVQIEYTNMGSTSYRAAAISSGFCLSTTSTSSRSAAACAIGAAFHGRRRFWSTCAHCVRIAAIAAR